MKKILLALLLITNTAASLFACCGFEPHTLTELLLFDRYNRSIFQCRIYRTAADLSSGYFSEAKVNEVFKGKMDSSMVVIYTGGNTTAGGQYLKPYSDWLIFSSKGDDGAYNATVCDWFSCSTDNPERYYNTLQIVSTYKNMTQNAGSGAVIWYYPDGVKAAEGQFLKVKRMAAGNIIVQMEP